MKTLFSALTALVLLSASTTAEAYFRAPGSYQQRAIEQVPVVESCDVPAGWPSWIDHPCAQRMAVVPTGSFGGGVLSVTLDGWPSWIGTLQ